MLNSGEQLWTSLIFSKIFQLQIPPNFIPILSQSSQFYPDFRTVELSFRKLYLPSIAALLGLWAIYTKIDMSKMK